MRFSAFVVAASASTVLAAGGSYPAPDTYAAAPAAPPAVPDTYAAAPAAPPSEHAGHSAPPAAPVDSGSYGAAPSAPADSGSYGAAPAAPSAPANYGGAAPPAGGEEECEEELPAETPTPTAPAVNEPITTETAYPTAPVPEQQWTPSNQTTPEQYNPSSGAATTTWSSLLAVAGVAAMVLA